MSAHRATAILGVFWALWVPLLGRSAAPRDDKHENAGAPAPALDLG